MLARRNFNGDRFQGSKNVHFKIVHEQVGKAVRSFVRLHTFASRRRKNASHDVAHFSVGYFLRSSENMFAIEERKNSFMYSLRINVEGGINLGMQLQAEDD